MTETKLRQNGYALVAKFISKERAEKRAETFRRIDGIDARIAERTDRWGATNYLVFIR